MLWMKAQLDLTGGFYRLVQSRNQFDALPAFDPVDQRSRPIGQAVDNVLIICLVSKSVDIGRVDRILLDDFFVFGQLVRELPGLD